MSLLAAIKPAGPSGFGYGSTAADVVRGLELSGQTVLLTGCNSGIGFESLKAIAGAGATVLAAARAADKAERAAREAGVDAVPIACELSDPDSVRGAIAAVRAHGASLDAILCNAGIMALPQLQTQHGLELQFFTNHVGHFLLVTGLLDQLAPNGRVVMVSSNAHRRAPDEGIAFDNLDGARGYSPWGFYGQSKLANLLFARELARRLPEGQTANALHPGVIHTNLGRHMGGLAQVVFAVAKPLVLKSTEQGAATQVWAAVHPDAARLTGEYLKDCNVTEPSRHGRDDAMARRLWERTEEIVAGL